MNEKLLEQIASCPRLPSLPAAAIEVLQLCRRDDVAISEIARTISRDPALSVKILQTVNSGYYGLPHKVSSISHAMVLLGINTVKTLALSFSLVGNLRDLGAEGFDPQILWRRSLMSAVGARGVALKLGGIDGEEAFLAGLLQDLGVLALLQALGKPYVKLLKAAGPAFANLRELERASLGLDHAMVGERLAAQWKLPEVLLQPIRYHECPEEYQPGAPPPMVIAVALGGLSMQPFLPGDPADTRHAQIDAYLRAARKWSPLDEEGAARILQFVGDNAPGLIRHFDLPEGPIMDPQEIVAQAQEILADLTLRTQLEAQQALEQAAQIRQQATLDRLTQLINRGGFEDRWAYHFAQAAQTGQTLSLIMLDLDHFKSINDTHGHPAGDRALAHAAQIVRALLPEHGCAARYGGEEFAVILPGMGAAAAFELAEAIRVRLAAAPIVVDGAVTVPITASLGVATMRSSASHETPEQMLAAADQALYLAKNAGRNRVAADEALRAAPGPSAAADEAA